MCRPVWPVRGAGGWLAWGRVRVWLFMSDVSAVVAGRYRLEGRIWPGGVGEVWKGTDVVLGRPVAVKLLRAGYAQNPGSLARFRSEARHAASRSHPGIAAVYDSGQAEPPYLVMELVDGPSLAQVLGGGPLDPGPAMDVVAGGGQGLNAAHRAGLIHVTSSRRTCCSPRAVG